MHMVMSRSTRQPEKSKRLSSAAAPPQLQLREAGRLVLDAGRRLDLEPKDALLLAYLALEGPTPRARLATLLWPDAGDERARGNLRQRLMRLKRSAGIEPVVGNPQAALAPGVAHDLDDAHEVLQAIEPQHAAGLAEWLDTQREGRRRARSTRLDAAATQAETEGDLTAALEHADALVALDPLSEHAHRRVMKLHYLRGDTAAALAAYERCRQTLRRELNAAPSKETESLRASVGAALVPLERAPAARAVPLSVLRPPRLIGRDAEWAALQRAWDEHEPALVLGEAGMGKTRLLSDFARSRAHAAIVPARPGDERVVYALIARLLRLIAAERLAVLDAGIRNELARLLPELGEAAPIRSDAERARFFNAVAAALQAQQPRVAGVIVDDLHFADDASVELIQYLEGTGCQRWVFAGRPAELGAAARALTDAVRDRGQLIDLQPLDEAQIARLVESLALPDIDAAAMAPLLARHTGGNPLFVLESLKGWLTQGGQATDARLPAVRHVGALIERRIGRLSPAAVRLARCAAVAGQDFSAELAARVLSVQPLDLADAWGELEAAQVFRDGAFAHDLIADAARASVPAAIARELHGQIARLLADRDAAPARLAEHWLAAGRHRQALDALMRAAAEAHHQALRLAEAAQLYEGAVAVAEQLGDREAAFDALHALLETLIALDRDRVDEALIDRLDAQAATPRRQAQALSLRGHVLLHRGRYAQAIPVSQRAADLARAAGDEELAAASLSDAAAAASQVGDADRAVRLLRPLLPWALEHASDDTRINLLGHLGLSLDNIDHQAEAQSVHQRAIEAATHARRFDEAVSAAGNLAISLLDVGRPRAALDAIAQARRLGAAYDELHGHSFSLNLFEGVAAMMLRRYRTALATLEIALADVAHNALAAAALSVHRACLWLHLGQTARAQRELGMIDSQAAVPAWLDARRQQMLGRCAWALERRADAARHWDAAASSAPMNERTVLAAMIALDRALVQPAAVSVAEIQAVLAKAERLGHFGSMLAARVRLAGLACQHGDIDTAQRVCAELAQTPDDIEPNDLYGGERWLASARVLHAAGRRDEAARGLAAAAATIRRIARDEVPPEFRDSYLDRNPVNRELLALASRLA